MCDEQEFDVDVVDDEFDCEADQDEFDCEVRDDELTADMEAALLIESLEWESLEW